MSYDVSLRVKVEGIDAYTTIADGPNITWNVRELIEKSSGWCIKNEAGNGSVYDWYEKIQRGIRELTFNPEEYRQYESPNGWGTVEGTLEFYRDCIEMIESVYQTELLHVAEVYVC